LHLAADLARRSPLDGGRRRPYGKRGSHPQDDAQIAGAFAEYEKSRLVGKLKHARDRKRQDEGKCEGRKSHAELRPAVVVEAKRLHRASPKTGERRSLRKIAAELAAMGHLNEPRAPYSAKSVRAMLRQ
jgi:hypothetical protein